MMLHCKFAYSSCFGDYSQAGSTSIGRVALFLGGLNLYI